VEGIPEEKSERNGSPQDGWLKKAVAALLVEGVASKVGHDPGTHSGQKEPARQVEVTQSE
jgi:hypothetical protein